MAKLAGMFIKICGITSADAVSAAATAQVDAIGFVFAPSPRQVTPGQAAQLAALAPPGMLRIAVAQHPLQMKVDEICRVLKPDYFQTDVEDLRELRIPAHIKVLPVQYDNDSAATAATQVEGDITAHPDLSGVFATNVLSAQGAATGVDHAGKSGAVKLATFDADPQQIQALKSNTIQLAIAQDPFLEGEDGVIQAVNALTGKTVTANIGTPLVAITQQNMTQPSVSKYVYVSSCSS